MRHFIILLFAALAGYFTWKFAPLELKAAIIEFAGEHAAWIFAIVGVLLAALVAAFYTQSIKLL